MSFQYGDIVGGKPSRIVDPVPDHAVGKIITAANNDPELLAKGHVEILTSDGKRYWMIENTVELVLPKTPKFPEHEKLAAISAQSQAIGEFLTWATEQGYKFGQDLPYDDGGTFFRQGGDDTVRELTAQFFEIDLGKIEAEKKLMLQYAQYPKMWMD